MLPLDSSVSGSCDGLCRVSTSLAAPTTDLVASVVGGDDVICPLVSEEGTGLLCRTEPPHPIQALDVDLCA